MERFKRRNFFIDKKFQTQFIIKFSLIVIAASLLIGFSVLFLSRGFTTVTIENTKVAVKDTSHFIFPIMVQTIVIANILGAIVTIILTLFTSHRIAGPLFRIKREIELLKRGNLKANFRIRQTDQLQDLAVSLLELTDSLRARYSILKDKAMRLKNSLQSPSRDDAGINAALEEIEKALNEIEI